MEPGRWFTLSALIDLISHPHPSTKLYSTGTLATLLDILSLPSFAPVSHNYQSQSTFMSFFPLSGCKGVPPARQGHVLASLKPGLISSSRVGTKLAYNHQVDKEPFHEADADCCSVYYGCSCPTVGESGGVCGGGMGVGESHGLEGGGNIRISRWGILIGILAYISVGVEYRI